MTSNRMKLIGEIRKWLEEDADDMLREMLRIFAEVLMSAEADQICGAEHGERSPDRVNQRNGYRSRRWDTRTGLVPRTDWCHGLVSGRPGRLPARAPHGSGRAEFPHPALQAHGFAA